MSDRILYQYQRHTFQGNSRYIYIFSPILQAYKYRISTLLINIKCSNISHVKIKKKRGRLSHTINIMHQIMHQITLMIPNYVYFHISVCVCVCVNLEILPNYCFLSWFFIILLLFSLSLSSSLHLKSLWINKYMIIFSLLIILITTWQ